MVRIRNGCELNVVQRKEPFLWMMEEIGEGRGWISKICSLGRDLFVCSVCIDIILSKLQSLHANVARQVFLSTACYQSSRFFVSPSESFQCSKISLCHLILYLSGSSTFMGSIYFQRLAFLYLLFSSIHITCLNSLHSCALSLISLMLGFSLDTSVLCQSCTLLLHIWQSMHASLLCNLLRSSALSANTSLPCNIAVYTQASYSPFYTIREKRFLANRGNSCLNILHPVLTQAAMLWEHLPLLLIRSPR